VAGVLRRQGLLGSRVTVALSGGLDSMVLLHALRAVARAHPLQLAAVHVDHGISPHSEAWARFCADRCAALDVPLQLVKVDVPRAAGTGPEAAARAARYAVFAQQPADAIALAHHLDDQAETVLLQLLRGAGAGGLAAMPEVRALPGSAAVLVRPLLELSRAQLEQYARSAGIDWVEDDSNRSLDFDRNYLRHEVLPRIAARFPGYRQTFLRASRNLAELAEIGQEMARIDAASVQSGDALRVSQLLVLPAARRLNLLRAFLQQHQLPAQPRERLESALQQLLGAAADRSPRVRLGLADLRRYRGLIQVVPATLGAGDWRLSWQGEAELALPAGYGAVRFHEVSGEGLSAAHLSRAAVVVAPRSGGERLKLWPSRPQRTLKSLLREAALPPWQRERIPLLFCGEMLAWAPGVGLDCRLTAQTGEAGVVPEWVRPE
jgi:tRNA(Ile)-lysidine synthase